jgi:hypothetical protein
LPPAGHFPGVRSPATNFQAVQNALQTLPLGETFDLAAAHSAVSAIERDISGNFFYVDQAPNGGYATITFNDKTRAGPISFTAFPGAVFRIPFTYVRIENTAQPGLSLVCRWGVDIDIVPSMSASLFGAVQVVDGGKARTIAGQAFVGTGLVNGVAANYSLTQIYNPAASGKNVFVKSFVMSAGTAGEIRIKRYDTPLANLSMLAASKKIGGAASLTEYRTENALAFPGTGSILFDTTLLANSPFPYKVDEQYELEPGKGLLIGHTTVNVFFNLSCEHIEEAVG